MSDEHNPLVKQRPKFDTPTGLFCGACTCGWVSNGIESESRALRSAEQHVGAKRGQAVERPEPPRVYLDPATAANLGEPTAAELEAGIQLAALMPLGHGYGLVPRQERKP